MSKANIVSFSGGRTSAYLVHCIEKMRKNGEIDNVHYVFMDTGAEHPKTYEFIKQVVKHFNIDLVCIRAVTNLEIGKGNTYEIININDIGHNLKPWTDMSEKYGLPYVHGAFCTDRMKTTPYNKWAKDTFGKDNFTSWLGIRIDELNRLSPKKGIKYLAEISPMDKLDIIGFWREMPFDLDINEWEGNCVFCVKKGVNKIALAVIDNPDLAKQFQDVIASDKVRHRESQQEAPKVMYRGNMTLEQIINTYGQFSREQIMQSMRSSSGSCTESCEVFGCQIDMFGD